jgi:hypothetical protein
MPQKKRKTYPDASALTIAGKNMVSSAAKIQFYFADAAMQATLSTLTEKPTGKRFGKRFAEVIDDVNQALAYIIGQYVKRAKPIAKSS